LSSQRDKPEAVPGSSLRMIAILGESTMMKSTGQLRASAYFSADRAEILVPWAFRILAVALTLSLSAFASARGAETNDRPELTIDVPVTLPEAKVALNISRLTFEGDEPTGLSFLRSMTEQFRKAGTKATIIAVFHGPSGYMLLGNDAYDRVRNWHGGNPYKDQIAALQSAGIQFEECGETMANNKWINADMLPGVKINTGANFRIVELVQQGFVQLQP
jgi:intracellular sulfur oxidation DsrE/DsrF family protein